MFTWHLAQGRSRALGIMAAASLTPRHLQKCWPSNYRQNMEMCPTLELWTPTCAYEWTALSGPDMFKLEPKASVGKEGCAMNLDQELRSALDLPLADDSAVRERVQMLLTEVRSQRPARRRRRIRLSVALITIGALGVGGIGTAAAGSMHFPWDRRNYEASAVVTFPSGDICATAFTVNADYVGPASYDGKTAAGAAGSAYLKTFDLGSLDYSQALKSNWRQQSASDAARITAELPPFSPQEKRTWIEGSAVSSVVCAALTAELKRQGFSAGVGLTGEAHCDAPGTHE